MDHCRKYEQTLHDISHYKNAQLFHNGKYLHSFNFVEHELLSYISMQSFFENNIKDTLPAVNSNIIAENPWKNIKEIKGKIHEHVCGHANFANFKLLLERNRLLNNGIQQYVTKLLNKCPDCKTTAPEQHSRKFSISSLSKQLNDIVFMEHFFLHETLFISFMDDSTRFVMAAVVDSTVISKVLQASGTTWISIFWNPEAVKGDSAFVSDKFRDYHNTLTNKHFELIPPESHSKNTIQSRHSVISTINPGLVAQIINKDQILNATKGVKIWNHIYGNTIVSTYEMGKG